MNNTIGEFDTSTVNQKKLETEENEMGHIIILALFIHIFVFFFLPLRN